MRIFLGLLMLALAGCQTTGGPPRAETVVLPVTKFVPIDAALLVPCAIATGTLAEILDVARARRASLEACNAQLDAIRALQPDAED